MRKETFYHTGLHHFDDFVRHAHDGLCPNRTKIILSRPSSSKPGAANAAWVTGPKKTAGSGLTAPVFVVATANDIAQLPPEFLRKGRFDEPLFIDLPNRDERQDIWRIQIAKYGRKPEAFDLGGLAQATEGWTGSEIEQAFIDALYDGFSRTEEPTDLSIAMQISQLVPLSKLMAEQINALRQWARGRARPATKPAAEPRTRKIAAS